nr:hypothetical protein [Acidithiobacillus ferriphilus]
MKAAYWYKKAAQQENISAEYTLGLMYANGQGVDKNNKAAIYWWQKAAAQGGEYGNIARHNITIVEHNNSEQG